MLGGIALPTLSRRDALVVCAASVARFYGEGLTWALALPLPQLLDWQRLVPAVRAHDPNASAVWIRKPPKGDE